MSTATVEKFDLGVLPAFARSSVAKKGMVPVDLKSLGILPGIGGGAKGYNQASDLVTTTNDGVDLNDLWAEYQTTLGIQNAARTRLVQFLTFPVSNPIDRVSQVSQGDFELASEYGEPQGIRPAASYFNLGYDFNFYDLAARFTWKFLAEAPRSQVDAINAMAVEADNRLIFRKVMKALFSNVNRDADINGVQDVPVYALYNADGTVPPEYNGVTFDGTHNHYMASGAATMVSEDFDDLYNNVAEHGYSWQNGYTLVLLANEREIKEIRKWRTADGDSWDFIPSQGSPGFFIGSDQLLLGGGQPANTYKGLNVAGAYGNVLVIEEPQIPAGYVALFATGGPENLGNPVGFREHSNASLRGLRLVKGANPDYPLIDSFYNRGFGTGIRQRGGAAVMKITAGAYSVPPAFA